MASPLGHTLIGLTLARRLGVRSPYGMAAATVAASLPDADVIAGLVLHGDPWKLHRKSTHTLGFALTAGMLAGFTGLVSAGSAEGERDLVADAMAGALLVGSHIALDYAPVPYFSTPERGMALPKLIRNNILNVAIDAIVYGAIAWKLWPRDND